MKVKLEYNEEIGWLHLGHIKDVQMSDQEEKEVRGYRVLKRVDIEYAIAFQEYIIEKFPFINRDFMESRSEGDYNYIPYYSMKEELNKFLTERKLK